MTPYEPQETKIITPTPFFKVKFGCSNRAFYGVKNEAVEALSNAGLEPYDGYFTEKCDYEGDLEEIIFYRGGREEEAAKAIIDLYQLDVPEAMNIHLSIH